MLENATPRSRVSLGDGAYFLHLRRVTRHDVSELRLAMRYMTFKLCTYGDAMGTHCSLNFVQEDTNAPQLLRRIYMDASFRSANAGKSCIPMAAAYYAMGSSERGVAKYASDGQDVYIYVVGQPRTVEISQDKAMLHGVHEVKMLSLIHISEPTRPY